MARRADKNEERLVGLYHILTALWVEAAVLRELLLDALEARSTPRLDPEKVQDFLESLRPLIQDVARATAKLDPVNDAAATRGAAALVLLAAGLKDRKAVRSAFLPSVVGRRRGGRPRKADPAEIVQTHEFYRKALAGRNYQKQLRGRWTKKERKDGTLLKEVRDDPSRLASYLGFPPEVVRRAAETNPERLVRLCSLTERQLLLELTAEQYGMSISTVRDALKKHA